MTYVEFDCIEPGELLFHDDFADPDLSKRWEISGGEWTSGDGYCTGIYRENAGGLIYTHARFPDDEDIMLDFYGTIISPCNNDLNFSFRARGWDYEKGDADIGYIASLNGWYQKRCGIEKYPECALRALSESFCADSDREYHIRTGIVGGKCFLEVDGKMLLTLSDPDSITEDGCDRVGLGTFCSHIRFRDFKVYRPKIIPVDMTYTAEF